jgi:hypothetical protein
MHFDQNILFVIIVAIVGIFRLISRIAKNVREQSQRNNPRSTPSLSRESRPLPSRSKPKSDEERVREFLEALGQPAGTKPPPRMMPRTNLPPRPLAPVQPPLSMRPFSPIIVPAPEQPRKKIAEPKERKQAPVETKPVVVLPPLVTTRAEANEPGSWISVAELSQAPTIAPTVPAYEIQGIGTTEVTWKNALRSAGSIRSAIILREILGPPRALQPFELALTRA